MKKHSLYNRLLFDNKEEIILIVVGLLSDFMRYAFLNFFVIFNGDFTMRFSDPDDYMQLVRLRDFFAHGDLTYSLVNRVNVPYGTDIYWSRLYDFLLIIPIWFVDFFVNSINKSIEYVCFYVSPIIHGILSIIVYNFFQKMIKKSNAFLGALLFAIAPYFGEISQFGRPDHHIFILTLEIAYLYSILNIAKNNFERRDDYIKSGVIAALCIWAAIETLSLVLLAEMVIFFFSYKDAEKLGLLLKKSLITLNSIGITVLLSPPIAFANILAFSILLVVSIITFHRPVHWHSVFYAMLIYYFSMDGSNAYDKISVMHIVLYLYAALYFMANIFCVGFGRTLFFAIATGLSFGGIFLYRYPKFLLGVEGGASDLLRNAWFPNIQDLTSPFGCNFLNSLCFLAYGIIIFVAIYDKAINLLSKKHENMDVFSWLLIIVNVVYFVFTCMAKRMILVSATVSLPLIIEMGTNRVFVKLLSRKVAVLNICLLVLAPPVVQRYGRLITELLFNRSSLKEGIRKKQHELYSKDEIYKFLDEMLGDTPTVIMASVYAGPRLLYCTKHNVVAVPFHSQERGIILALIVTSFQSDIADVRAVLKSTNSSYIFLEKSKLSSLFHEPWAEFIELPSEVYALIKIDKGKL